ncbi:DUF2911 domain-containing protein [Spirosoma sp. KUDC1026]|uniref:DUF2911 domain-containing protein n=1 Tax=Spirosoma sp. KUDC1026 TaxID=2745947 RepID=UPI00159BC289|nr:DUF2911 domain-containing protein [Spirosoma sp. KUDC1026]QKZ13866.1 DUF2911 domain-containing protein [Spirosoma sp. KUDC1026]
MKSIGLLVCLFVGVTFAAEAQKMRGLDKSPMDMAYYPDDFAHDRKFAPAKVGDTGYARVIYSRPAKNGREVFGKLVPYGKVWRVGANEATEIKLLKDATIQGKTVKAGVYALYAIPTETAWTIILNSDLDQWGAYSYKQDMDVLRVTAPVKKTDEPVENLTIQFRKVGDNAKESVMMIAWDTTLIEVPISF